jgi:hypothetical protein
MEKIWHKLYKWPKDKAIACSCSFNWNGSVNFMDEWSTGNSYSLIGFGYYWRIK